VCDYLRGVFDSKKVNIILISNDVRVRESLKSNSAFNKRMSFYDFKERGQPELQSYLLEKVNYGIRKEEKKFNADNIALFLTKIGWTFQALHEYISQIDKFDSVEDFVSKYGEKEINHLASHGNQADVVRCLISISGDSGNRWVDYGNIKRNCGNGPSEKLDEAVSNNILVKKNNLYKFKNNAAYFAALASARV